ncbi:MAG TPA: pilin [Candidatus Paceibacterota bacterium]|nr:pilin [Candidatus Pacearchaeota archaeon]HRZ51202.1 pilin [Candidatus Paceibacterota bacterium]HSA36924.1 pilin [Candidatus Paceibacterota bacterium]
MAKPINKKLFSLLAVAGCFAFFALAYALETSWPESPMKTKVDDTTNLAVFIKYIYEWGIALGGVATFIAFVIAGFQYITSIGDPQTMKDAVDRIKSAMFGLVLLLSAYVLLNTINPELVSFRLDPFNPQLNGEFFESCQANSGTCRPGYECKLLGEKGICWPKDYAGPVCKDAEIYSQTNFKGTKTVLSVNETLEGGDNMPKSVRARYIDDDCKEYLKKNKDKVDGRTSCYCDERVAPSGGEEEDSTTMVGEKNGCGCVLRLYNEDDGWLWSDCGDVITDVPAYEADLTQWFDRDVYCVELLSPGADK